MCSVALSLREQLPPVVRRSRGFLALSALTITSACSVYSSDLLNAAGGGAGGGSGLGGTGHAGGIGGGSSGAGGKPVANMAGNSGSDDTAAGESAGGSPDGGAAGVPSTGRGGGGTAAGGTAAIAGSSGSGGTAGVAGSGGAGGPDLVDGFEDNDLTLEQTSGRGGVWYLFDDATVGTTGPKPLACSPLTGAPAALGMYAMHITATGFTGFGSGLGVDFRAGKKVYDASKFTGIRFWAKVGVGKNTKHRVQIADATTDAAGGKCNPAATAPNGEKCSDHFGVDETFTTSWVQYIVPFDQMTQLGWGTPAPAITKTALYGLQVTAKPKLEVDLWLDQIEFF